MPEMKTALRVVVTGGRDYAKHRHIWRVLNHIHARRRIVALATGDCHRGGADEGAKTWAMVRGIPYTGFPVPPAEWTSVGRKAGPLRNRRLLDEFRPDVVVAFPGGTGTADCTAAARERGIPVYQPEEPA